jgi:hypothetical protein
MTPGSPPDPASPGDPRLGRLLRWYPRAWRERYGKEFLALVEDTLDGDRPGWRLLLAGAWSGLRERGHATRLAGRRALLRLARGVAGDPGSVAIVAGYLAAILPHELGAPPARQTGVILDTLTALIGLAGLALLAGGLAALPALIRLLRAGRRPKVRRRLVWAVGATVATAAGLAWLTLWSGTSSLTPLSTSPTCIAGLIGTIVALAVALSQWAGVARRLDLGPRVRAVERRLGTVAVPVIIVLMGVSVVWYSVLSSSEFWLVWGVVWLAGQSRRMARELRKDRPG